MAEPKIKKSKQVWFELPPAMYEAATKRMKALLYPSFSEYVRALIRKDTAEQQ